MPNHHLASRRRSPPNTAFGLSDTAKLVLRCIRNEVDGEGRFTGSVDRAAFLAELPAHEADAALRELSNHGLVRSKAPNASARPLRQAQPGANNGRHR